jgi:hypothetical protein
LGEEIISFFASRDLDAVRYAWKSPFEKNVVVNFEMQVRYISGGDVRHTNRSLFVLIA